MDKKPAVHARDHAPGGADPAPWLERIHMIGTLAARPAASPANKGAFYLVTDNILGGGGLVETRDYKIDGYGSTITTGVKDEIRIDYACQIIGWTLMANASGSIVVDIWKDVLANYPPTVADTITAGAKPTLASADHASSTTLTGWTTAVAAGDVLRFNVDSVTTVQRVMLSLTLQRT